MPLPPRDFSAVHVALNPVLAEMHTTYPMSRYVPVMAIFKLYNLVMHNVGLVAILTPTSWMTLACLDDASSDYVISATVTSLAWSSNNRDAINTVLTTTAAPFLVPMLVPVPAVQHHRAPSSIPETPGPKSVVSATATTTNGNNVMAYMEARLARLHPRDARRARRELSAAMVSKSDMRQIATLLTKYET